MVRPGRVARQREIIFDFKSIPCLGRLGFSMEPAFAEHFLFVEFFAARPETPIPTFWEWDSNNNPEKFKQEQPA